MTLSDEEPGDARLYLDSSWSRRSDLHRVTVLGEYYHESLRSISVVISRDTWSTKVNNCAGTDLTLEQSLTRIAIHVPGVHTQRDLHKHDPTS